MRFWLISGLLYLTFLMALLFLPVGALWDRQGLDALAIGLYFLTALAIFLATLIGCLMVAKALFPQFWWMGQVLGQDIFEFDGIYFVGVRLSRVPSRLQRILFGVDERFRWWDLLFGVTFLVLLVPHVLATVTSYRHADMVLPRRIVFPETLHAATLSSLPIMREWQVKWTSDAIMKARLTQEYDSLQARAVKTDADWFRLAQVQLLLAFHPRQSVLEPFIFSPSDRVYFDRGQGAQATTIAQKLISGANAANQPFRTDALVLVGFFHLSDYRFAKAEAAFREALSAMSQGATGAIPRPLVMLLAAHSAALNGNTDAARRLLEPQLSDEGLPPPMLALTLEHLGDVLRMQDRYSSAQQFLDNALAAYKKQKDDAGIARVYMYRAAIYLDQGKLIAASQEISRASSQGADGGDLFTYNMVVRISHLMPAIG